MSGILIGFAIHHVAPVAPHRSDIQQDRLILLLCCSERVFAHSIHFTGWCMALRKYAEEALASALKDSELMYHLI